MKLYQLKSSTTLDMVVLSAVKNAKVAFGQGEELHQVELTLDHGRTVDLQMTTEQLETFTEEWETAL